MPFYPTNNPENKISEKLKKSPGDIIILKMCTINENHIMYGSETWRATDNKKIKKTPVDITTLHKCTKNHDHMLYCYRDMARDGCN